MSFNKINVLKIFDSKGITAGNNASSAVIDFNEYGINGFFSLQIQVTDIC